MTNRPRFKRRRHVARSARILSTGISATAILAMTAAYGAAEQIPSVTESNSATVDTSVAMESVGFVDSASVQPALAPLGVASTSSSAPQSASSESVGVKRKNTATKTTDSTSTAPLNVIATGETPAPVETLPPVDTVAPVVTVAPQITVTPITAAPTPVQLEVPKSSNGSTSGGSR